METLKYLKFFHFFRPGQGIWAKKVTHAHYIFLPWSEEPAYALGVHFAYERDTVLRKIFWDKLISLKKLLNIWSQRAISVYGKINLVKSLALSKLVFICSVMETPNLFVDEVNKIAIDFIWVHKPPKIKYTKLIKTRQEGALEKFSLFNKALKLQTQTLRGSISRSPF